MPPPRKRNRITTTIKRQWLAKIVAGTKKNEYREMKPYWQKKLAGVSRPFQLRLINGMKKRAPDVLVEIDRVRSQKKTRQYALHIARVVSYRHWSKTRGKPT